MKNYKIKTRHKMMLADTITPVSIYLRLRDKFANTILLESSDYHGHENSLSYICCKPIASIKAQNGTVEYQYPDSTSHTAPIAEGFVMIDALEQFMDQFEIEKNGEKFVSGQLFGFMTYEAVQHYEDITFRAKDEERYALPDLHYQFYQYVIIVDHLP